jgi:riboflavin synthase|tara:strand:- start:841 stop:1416 length:576 start_codon:yes stop_codon:yes gene_type:complete
MFTGIVKSVGSVKTLEEDHLLISTDDDNFYNLETGTSISIDGCCLTLREYINKDLLFQISDETISRTSLNKDHCGFVNMELPLTVNSLLSGHIVQGHVDGVIELDEVTKLDNELWNFHFKYADEKYIVDKGSITINGISLTVVEPDKDKFSVAVIEETYKRTNLKHLKINSSVNVEYDIVIKYLEKLNYDK